jgi:tetratricopeptide (TPR) repeat protein
LTHLQASVLYAEAGTWLAEVFMKLHDSDAARKTGRDAARLAERVLALRPTYGEALHAEQVINNDLGLLETLEMHPRDALPYIVRGREISGLEMKLNPGNSTATNNLAVTYLGLGDAEWSIGEIKKSIADYAAAGETGRRIYDAGTWFVWNSLLPYGTQAQRQADAGMLPDAKETLTQLGSAVSRLRSQESADASQNAVCFQDLAIAGVAIVSADPHGAREHAQLSIGEAKEVPPGYPNFYKQLCRGYGRYVLAQAQYLLADYAAAEQAARDALSTPNNGSQTLERDHADYSTWLALALARQGRLTDAAQAIAPAVKLHREIAVKNRGDDTQTIQLAAVLYAQALSDTSHRAALLKEAAALIDRTSPGIRNLASTRLWRTWITAASSQR